MNIDDVLYLVRLESSDDARRQQADMAIVELDLLRARLWDAIAALRAIAMDCTQEPEIASFALAASMGAAKAQKGHYRFPTCANDDPCFRDDCSTCRSFPTGTGG